MSRERAKHYADVDADIREMAERLSADFSSDPNLLAGAIASALYNERESQARIIEELVGALEMSLIWNDAWLEPKNVQYWSPDQYDACVDSLVSVRTALSKAKQS